MWYMALAELTLLACVFAAMSGPLETHGGASTSCLMCLH
jgi:hypothetical protein